MKNLIILTMGGTIDSEAYPTEDGQYPDYSTHSATNASFQAVSRMPKITSRFNVSQIKICDKDSKDYNDADRKRLLQLCCQRQNPLTRIMVTCGTDRMVETATWLTQHLLKKRSPIVFTGAIWPLANGPKISDGFDNLLKASLKNNGNLRPDVYIAMGNLFMPARRVIKDFNKKEFILRR